MQKLQQAIQSRPDLKSDRSQFLQLAIKEGNAVRGTGPQRVKIVNCENAVNKDYKTQQPIKGVNLIFEQNGTTKKYFVPILGDDGKFHYLFEKFADIPEGTELIVEYKRKEGSVKGFIDVQLAGESEKVIEINEEIEMSGGELEKVREIKKIPIGEPPENLEIPVIEEDEIDPENY